MKPLRIICFCLGLIFIIMNVIVDIVNPDKPNSAGQAYNVGYIIGSHLFLIVGVILLAVAYRQHKKIIRRSKLLSEEAINSIGSSNED